jgi:hypothetical protein
MLHSDYSRPLNFAKEIVAKAWLPYFVVPSSGSQLSLRLRMELKGAGRFIERASSFNHRSRGSLG